MTLDVIGAGFGRNGTESLKRALELLGHGPCMHMHEVIGSPERVALWRGIALGAAPDWDAAFDGYRATVDWPGAHYWRELAMHYPEAKIILSIRDPEDWYASMDKTILKVAREATDPEGLAVSLLKERVFGGNVEDRDHVLGVYARHNADVQAAFGADRLLTYELGSGWEPLCRFLDCPIPQEPYPTGNEEEAFHAKRTALEAARAAQEGR